MFQIAQIMNFLKTLLYHPAVGIQLRDIAVYVDWLSFETGKKYRLLEDQEWRSVMDHVISGNASEDMGLHRLITDEHDLMLNSSSELTLDSGFRVVRDIDPIYK